MKLEKIRINGFGKILEKDICFSKKLNIIYGPNESGKSTIQAFIKAMLFGFGKSRASGMTEKEKFKPWNAAAYGGMLEYTLDNMKSFSIWRDFNSKQAKIYNHECKDITNEFDKSKAGGVLFAQEHLGVSAVLFESTCFAPQEQIRLNANDQALLTDKITNMVETGSESISYIKASKAIEKALTEEVGTDRTSERPINRINDNIKRLEKERSSCENILKSTRALEEQLEELKKDETVLRQEIAAANNLYKGKADDRNYSSAQMSDKEIEELKINLEHKEIELKDIGRSIPSGSAVFDDDVAEQLTGLQALVRALGLKYKILLCCGIGMLIYAIGSAAVIKELRLSNIIPGIISVISILIGFGLYHRPFMKAKYEIRDILTAASIKTTAEYFEKKREIYFLLEKKRIIEESAELIRSQIKTVSKGNIIDNEQLRKTESKIIEIETEIKVLSTQAVKLPEIEEELERCKQEKKKLEEFAWCLSKAKKILDESNEQLKSDIVPGLSKGLSDIAYGLTGEYKNIKADACGQGIKVILEDGNVIPLDSLSGGTIDQIYFALRAAGLNMISENGETLPFVLDEPFSQFDDKRIKRACQILDNISKKNQVIIFTCRQDEAELIKAELPDAEVINL
ncbi:MAG: ATP-binding protein [Deltaproteobacteria bacterium]